MSEGSNQDKQSPSISAQSCSNGVGMGTTCAVTGWGRGQGYILWGGNGVKLKHLSLWLHTLAMPNFATLKK